MKQMKWLAPIKDERGNALISVFLIILVILVLGMGILTLTTSDAQQAVTVDTYERDYFVAEGGAKQGVEALKSAALERYRQIADDLKKNIQTTNTAASFFAYVDATACAPAQPDTSAGGPSSLEVTIAHTAPGAATHRYTVLSTAEDGTTKRSVSSTVDITFVPVTVTYSGGGFTPLGDETILVGGTFRQTDGDITVHNKGTVSFGAYTNPRSNPPAYTNYDGFNIDKKSTLYWIDPNTISRFNWDMKYPGFTDEAKTVATPVFTPANGGVIDSLKGNAAPIYIEGVPGASFKVRSINSGFTAGQIVCDGNLTLDSDTLSGSAGNFIKLYSAGNLTTTSTVLEYCKLFVDGNLSISGGSDKKNLVIYCGGNVSISSTGISNVTVICGGDYTIDGGSTTNVTIYCKGKVNDKSNTRTNMKVYCDSYTMSGGNIVGDSIVYAQSYIHLESTVSGLYYTNGNIDVTSGSGLTGQMAAKGDVYAHGSFSYYPDKALISRLDVDPFVTSSPGGSGGTIASIIQPLDSAIFTNTPEYSEQ